MDAKAVAEENDEMPKSTAIVTREERIILQIVLSKKFAAIAITFDMLYQQ